MQKNTTWRRRCPTSHAHNACNTHTQRCICTLTKLEDAVLPGQNIIHFLFPFRFEENIEEDRNHCQEAGRGHCGYNQPRKCRVCEETSEGT